MKNVTVASNYLHGGSYTLRNESAVGLAVKNNVFAGATYGPAVNVAPATIATWSGNTSPTGTVIPHP